MALTSSQANSSTLLTLNAENGTKVYVIGTAHFSKKSIQEVSEMIRKIQPNAVVVELCLSRLPTMLLDEKRMLSEAGTLSKEKINTILKESGIRRGSFQVMMLQTVAQMTKQLGQAPGGEFRMAFKECKRIQDCVTILGDRPVNITFERAVSSLTWPQYTQLMMSSLGLGVPVSNQEDINEDYIEKLKEKNIYDESYKSFQKKYPGFTKAMIDERDVFLTYSLQQAAALKAFGKVVGVVGVAHLPGIKKHWGLVTENQVLELLKIPMRAHILDKISLMIPIGLACGAIYGIHSLFTRKRRDF